MRVCTVPRMAELIYTQKPSAIPTFLKHIQAAGDPGKMTQKYLETVGFKSKNDRDLLRVMRGLGFTDANGNTTDVWRAYRSSNDVARCWAAPSVRCTPRCFTCIPMRSRRTMRRFGTE